MRAVRLAGDMPREGRVAAVEAFQGEKDVSVILISLKAGGEGLNLQAANHVFLVDPWWNPASEMQAIDRTHRIGQTRAVRRAPLPPPSRKLFRIARKRCDRTFKRFSAAREHVMFP